MHKPAGHVTPLRLALLLAAILAAARFSGFVPFEWLDLRALDYRLQQRGAQPGAPEVVIVAVDEASLDQVGRWSWSRATVARLLERISAAEPAVIGTDFVQSEPTAACALDALAPAVGARCLDEVRRAMAGEHGDDEQLVAAVRASQRVVLGYFFDFTQPDGHDTPDRESVYAAVLGAPGGRSGARVPRGTTATRNLPALSAVARGLGYFNYFPDPDGLYRRAPLAIRFGDRVALPLSLAMLRLYWPDRPMRIRFAEYGVASVHIGPLAVPVAEDGQLLINYRGPGGRFRYVSAADVLAGRVAPEVLRGKLVLVGITAVAAGDVRATPFDAVFPGVEIHANVLDNILRGDFLYQPVWAGLSWAGFADLAVIAGLALALGLALPHVRGRRGALLAVALLAAYLAGSQWLFVARGFVLSTIYPVLTVLVTYVAISVELYIATEREKRETRRVLDLYLSPSLSGYLSLHPDKLRLGGEKRERTVLFSDVREFTPIAENLEPEDLVELLNLYLGEMTDIVFAHDGMLDKYVGDGVMAVWGAPLPQEDHAARACRAALGMIGRLPAINAACAVHGWPPIAIRIGLASGPMVFGNMGSAGHLSLTVMGDHVNLGARLEGLNKVYSSTIMAAESTIQAAGDEVVARELDIVRVKGKERPVRVYEILGPGHEREHWAELIDHFHAGLAAYRAEQWGAAAAAFIRALGTRPNDGPSTYYLQRCREHLAAARAAAPAAPETGDSEAI